MITKTMLPFLVVVLLAGCATPLPARPPVSFYNVPDPPMIAQPAVPRAGFKRALQPPPVAAPICLTDADHLLLEAYFEQVEAQRTRPWWKR